jgi:hypothetical protein
VGMGVLAHAASLRCGGNAGQGGLCVNTT